MDFEDGPAAQPSKNPMTHGNVTLTRLSCIGAIVRLPPAGRRASPSRWSTGWCSWSSPRSMALREGELHQQARPRAKMVSATLTATATSVCRMLLCGG